ncbi:MarR family winged helix-turn-helix transcriptional regulator [Leucobacter sp. M11]|uniref:MarR family winged helix-turn-helix transcriptional regulator n=1 Tax=Leucobacter sp. M11 TaxID=2993565 RepID=UPI002D80AAA9|nr:MarR family transcriptional regulator [Leucobacter sp. M11]MEB4613943.1 MarR family transcriptional regulator [Leucobacter sp. M11]
MTERDEVDPIVEEWAAAHPDLDFSPLEVFSRVMRIAKRLDRVRANAFEQSGLAAWEFDVLAVLRRSGEPFRLSPKILVQATMVSSGTMTNRIDRMAERGLVARLTDPNDGRGVLVEMTRNGLTLVDAAITRLTHAEQDLLAGLSGAERGKLPQLLRRLGLSVEQATRVAARPDKPLDPTA